MTRVLLHLAGDFDVRVRPHQRSVFRFAIRVVGRTALVLDVRHGPVDDHLGCSAGRVRERHRVLDLVLMVVDASEDEDCDDLGVLLRDPIATVLKVEPRLKGRLRSEICIRDMEEMGSRDSDSRMRSGYQSCSSSSWRCLPQPDASSRRSTGQAAPHELERSRVQLGEGSS